MRPAPPLSTPGGHACAQHQANKRRVEYCRDAAAIAGAATARHSDRCRSKYCAVSGTEHALYVLAAQRALIRAQLPNSGSLATASAKGRSRWGCSCFYCCICCICCCCCCSCSVCGVCGHDFCYFRYIYPFEDVDVTSTPTNIFLLKVVSIDTESSGVPAGQGGGLMWQCICKITE